MRTASLWIVAVGLGLALPAGAAAQMPRGEDGWWDWALPAVAGGESIRTARGAVVLPWPGRGSEDRRARRRHGRGERGPVFCRNGQGHPVHGRRWCAEKGFGRYAGWRRVGWGDVILRGPRSRDERLRRGTLIDILGDVVFGRLDSSVRRAGDGPLDGRWVRAGGYRGNVLQVRAGSVPIAEFTDLDGDGRVDSVLVHGDG